jgi:2-methylisocitrate lyase-like PEP mutase family enzyme
MTRSTSEKRSAFRALHQEGCFLLPNPWDIGSARLFQSLGFSALASTSTGYAWTMGHPDYKVTRDAVLEHLTMLCNSTDLPLNADFESGFAADPEGVANNVKLAIKTGVAGLSIEDREISAPYGLYDTALAAERIKAARRAIDESGEDVVLVGRTEGLLGDLSAITPAIDKLVALADAGADCLYAPGVGMTGKKSDIAAMVKALAPKPVNVLVMGPGITFAELRDLGVRRISVGGALALVGWGAVRAAALELKDGNFDKLAEAAQSGEMNGVFEKFIG